MIILKTTLAFLLLLILARFLGKKQMSQMTFFNYMTGITIGSLAANIISNNDNSLLEEILGLVWWSALTILLTYATLKSESLRTLVDGEPVILIKNGLIQKESLKATKISLVDLSMMLREHYIFSITEVDYAILEPDGQLSVLKKSSQLNLTRADMDIVTPNPMYLPCQIITNGKIYYENLKNNNLDIKWLNDQLKTQNINNINQVLYAELQSDGSLYIDKL
jgi:uncharacterized membrane protein YcaP (DUF421 family)